MMGDLWMMARYTLEIVRWQCGDSRKQGSCGRQPLVPLMPSNPKRICQIIKVNSPIQLIPTSTTTDTDTAQARARSGIQGRPRGRLAHRPRNPRPSPHCRLHHPPLPPSPAPHRHVHIHRRGLRQGHGCDRGRRGNAAMVVIDGWDAGEL